MGSHVALSQARRDPDPLSRKDLWQTNISRLRRAGTAQNGLPSCTKLVLAP
jgi:hypothetical protein